ncbi:MAG: stage III sporulation protein AB [Oscillospiraceae bacterium]|nr:stage III sporulation protein AB [Oscillospiraceae bacterium]
MRWIGLLCLFLMSTATGFYAANRMRTRYRTMQKLVTLLSEFSTMLRYQGTPLEELLEQFACHPNYREFTFLSDVCDGFAVDVSPRNLWESSINGDPSILPQAGDILCSLGTILGTTDMQGQLAALELYRSRMEETADDIKAECIRKEGLYRRLGVLVGAMCLILLL